MLSWRECVCDFYRQAGPGRVAPKDHPNHNRVVTRLIQTIIPPEAPNMQVYSRTANVASIIRANSCGNFSGTSSLIQRTYFLVRRLSWKSSPHLRSSSRRRRRHRCRCDQDFRDPFQLGLRLCKHLVKGDQQEPRYPCCHLGSLDGQLVPAKSLEEQWKDDEPENGLLA